MKHLDKSIYLNCMEARHTFNKTLNIRIIAYVALRNTGIGISPLTLFFTLCLSLFCAHFLTLPFFLCPTL